MDNVLRILGGLAPVLPHLSPLMLNNLAHDTVIHRMERGLVYGAINKLNIPLYFAFVSDGQSLLIS